MIPATTALDSTTIRENCCAPSSNSPLAIDVKRCE